MQIKSNKIDGANAEIIATISMQEVNTNVEKIAKELTKTAKIDGFRKGKVPASAVKKQYGERLVQDAEAEALRDVLTKGLAELNITKESLIGEPNVTKFDKSSDKIEVAVRVAMRPQIDLGEYASMVAPFDKPVVADADIEKRIIDLAQGQANLVDVEKNRKLVAGDIAVIDFEGSVDGVLFDGGTAKDFPLTLGSGQFIPGFEEQVIGLKRDDEAVVKVTFPQNYGGKELAGKDAEFKVKVNKIQVKEEIQIDDALAAKMLPGEEDNSVAKLKELVKNQLENEALAKLYNETMKPALLESLVEGINFDLPEFVVEQEIDMALNKAATSMSEDEINELRQNSDKLTTLRESFREDASKSVKATFIIDSLAQAESVKVSEQEVMQTIYYEAMQMGQDPQKAYEHYKASGYIPAIQMSMVEDKVLSKILNTKIKKV